jgi:hypothetical protein
MEEPENYLTKVDKAWGQLIVELRPTPSYFVNSRFLNSALRTPPWCHDQAAWQAWQQYNLSKLIATYGENQIARIVAPTDYYRQYLGPNDVHQQEIRLANLSLTDIYLD